MRARLANSIVLDLGSSKIAALAAYVEHNGEARILCQNLSYSDGIKSGMITDLKQAENSLVNSIYAIEKHCDKNIKQAAISLSGVGTKSYYVYNVIKIQDNKPVTKQDIQKLVQKSIKEFKVKDQEIIHYFPIEFTLDNHNALQDPIGMLGRELGCRMHIITANSNMLLNLSHCLSKCQVEISNVFLAIYADGMSCLTEDEQNLGSVIIDIGAKTTSIGIFLGKKLLYSGYIPIGGWHITSDIAKAFAININAAEKIKLIYGNASYVSSNRDSMINLDDFDPEALDGLDNYTISIDDLSEIISPRVDEIFDLIKNLYDQLEVDHLIARRVVLTGGSSLLHGMKEVAGKVFSRQVRIGRPVVIPGFAEDCNPCIYSASLGMIKLDALIRQKNFYLYARPQKEDGGYFSKVIAWLKTNI
jgi:cell division protein FtsA